jgi:protein-S-isoprenylcysteine O-methyltransferase Ste14
MTGRVNMNKGRLIGGLICLALAALLGVLNVVLPADELMFTVGDENMPWVPPVILVIVGVVLLVTAVSGRQKAKV